MALAERLESEGGREKAGEGRRWEALLNGVVEAALASVGGGASQMAQAIGSTRRRVADDSLDVSIRGNGWSLTTARSRPFQSPANRTPRLAAGFVSVGTSSNLRKV